MDAAPRVPARRSVFAVRFSLRWFFTAFTAFAIGFPIWYRWPYTEEVFSYREINGQPDKSQPPAARSLVSWQRQWGGGRLQHGVTKMYRADGTIANTGAFRHGKPHGRREMFGEDGSLHWVEEHVDGTLKARTVFNIHCAITFRAQMAGRFLNGKAEQYLPDGTAVVWQFDHGRVVSRNDERIQSGLFDALAAGKVEKGQAERLRMLDLDPSYARALAQTPEGELEELAAQCGVPIVIDKSVALAQVEKEFPLWLGIDAPSVLVMKARALGRQCEYRDGRVWITSPSKEGQPTETPSSSLNQP